MFETALIGGRWDGYVCEGVACTDIDQIQIGGHTYFGIDRRPEAGRYRAIHSAELHDAISRQEVSFP
jgi:hypothetical protein